LQIGLVGLGKMGSKMVTRLVQRRHQVVAFDLDAESVREAERNGARGADSVADLVARLDTPRAVWVVVPHGEPTRMTITALLDHLAVDDVIIDGGNSHYMDSLEHARRCEERRLYFLDVGMSGGIWGLEVGYCLMAGGPREAYERLEPVLAALAPADGYALVGPSGAGHFVKMVHNGVEYAMLQGIGEGFELLGRSDFGIDLRQVAELWGQGSVVRSWLLELLAAALGQDGNELETIAPFIEESGTGRWTAEYGLSHGIALPAMTLALYERFASQTEDRFAHKVIAALRGQFGGHPVRSK
jgi:6-phosphogluconate dehydrogenase